MELPIFAISRDDVLCIQGITWFGEVGRVSEETLVRLMKWLNGSLALHVFKVAARFAQSKSVER